MKLKPSLKRAIALFVIYLTILTCLVLGVFYFVSDLLSIAAIAALTAGCFVIAFVATLVHLRTGKKNAVDGIVDRMP